ncbi:hypothetical protein [Jiella mangrovi]|uniref:hypothetical protein n=1 Tax=Jiella mangrovi TaxID=2821407 RepID=UPI001AE4B868|nr:hypothetical protein [Jiella mangrovi]
MFARFSAQDLYKFLSTGSINSDWEMLGDKRSTDLDLPRAEEVELERRLFEVRQQIAQGRKAGKASAHGAARCAR